MNKSYVGPRPSSINRLRRGPWVALCSLLLAVVLHPLAAHAAPYVDAQSDAEFEVLASYDLMDLRRIEVFAVDLDNEVALGIEVELAQFAPAFFSQTSHHHLETLAVQDLLEHANAVAGSMLASPEMRARIARGDLEDTLLGRVSGGAGTYGTVSAGLLNPALLSARDLFNARFASHWESYEHWMDEARRAAEAERQARADEEAARRRGDALAAEAENREWGATIAGWSCAGATALVGGAACFKVGVATGALGAGACGAALTGAVPAAYSACGSGVRAATGASERDDLLEQARREAGDARNAAQTSATMRESHLRAADHYRERAERAAQAEYEQCVESGGDPNACASEHLTSREESDEAEDDADESAGDGDGEMCTGDDASDPDVCSTEDDLDGGEQNEEDAADEDGDGGSAGRPNLHDTPSCTGECRERGEAWLDARRREMEDSVINWGPDGRPTRSMTAEELRRFVRMQGEVDGCDPRLGDCPARAVDYNALGLSPLRSDVDWGPDGPPVLGGSPPPGSPRAPLHERRLR